MPAKLTAHRSGYCVFTQRIECFFKGWVIHTRAGKTQVTAIGSRTGIVRELFGQRCKVFTLLKALLDFNQFGLSLIVIEGVIDLNEDVRSTALLSQAGDFIFVRALQVFSRHFNLVEEGILF